MANKRNDYVASKDEAMREGKTSSRKPTNKKSRNKSGSRNKKDFNQAKLDETGRNNKPGYYFVSKELAEQATQLSFNNVLGYGSVQGYKVPTIVRVDLVAGPGVTVDYASGEANINRRFMANLKATDPATNVPTVNYNGKAGVNLMAAKLYTLLSSFTGRTASYAPQDVAMMILAIAGITEYSEAIRRIFGLAMTYDYWNRTLAEGILKSMGINTEDFFANVSIYRMQFNVAMSRINQIPLLDNIAFIEKSREIYQDIYYDDPTNMSQIFYYMPRTWCYLDEEGDENGSVLRHITHNGSDGEDSYGTTVGDMISNLNFAITKVLESSTLNFIYADLLNMANKIKTPMWKFDYLAENYTVLPTYNENACLQFHNLNLVGGSPTFTVPSVPWDDDEQKPVRFTPEDSTFDVSEGYDVFCDADKNNVFYNPMFAFNGVWVKNQNNIIDMATDNPSLEDRIEALRFTTAWSGYWVKLTETTSASTLMVLPDHYPVQILMWDNVENCTPTYRNTSNHSVENSSIAQRFAHLTQWEHGPINKFIDINDQAITSMFGDLSYYTSVDSDYLRRLHNVMYVGLFEFRV